MLYPRPVRVWRLLRVSETAQNPGRRGGPGDTRSARTYIRRHPKVPGTTSGVPQGAVTNHCGSPGVQESTSGVPQSGVTNHCATLGSRNSWVIWRPPEWRDKSLCHSGVQGFHLASPRVWPPWGPGMSSGVPQGVSTLGSRNLIGRPPGCCHPGVPEYISPPPPPAVRGYPHVCGPVPAAARAAALAVLARPPWRRALVPLQAQARQADRQAGMRAGRDAEDTHGASSARPELGVPASASCDALLSVPGGLLPVCEPACLQGRSRAVEAHSTAAAHAMMDIIRRNDRQSQTSRR